jgi:PhnB protein
MHVQPYLNFNGRCDDAIAFYSAALGAEVTTLMRFKDCPESPMASPDSAEKVMHMELRIGDTVVLGSDAECTGQPTFQGISLALTLATDGEAERAFTALAHGGEVQMPLTRTFFSSGFGMLADRFGVSWMVVVAG